LFSKILSNWERRVILHGIVVNFLANHITSAELEIL
jgi:hypothetical protein